ncbi:MAG TPA: OmpA family protein [Chitinophagaceae bacterium]|nr:OmpA family protein [Chitinophagaceae bacterium]
MKRLVLTVGLLFCSAIYLFAQPDNAGMKVWSKYDFVPGDKIIFEDNLKDETVGEFPSRWKLTYGSAEAAKFMDTTVIGFTTGQSVIEPLMKKTAYLPEIFTIEFDVYFHQKGNEAYIVIFDVLGKLDIRKHRITLKSFSGSYTLPNTPGWHHVAIAFNQGKLKAYLNENKALNVPDAGGKPTKFSITSLSHGAKQGYPSFIRNIRVAEGGMDLYKRVVSDGKFITRGILFAVNKWDIKPESMGVLNEIANMMKQYPELKFSVEGHTDSDGDDASNKTLSEKRAEAIKKALTDLGISADRLSTKGWGETKPADDNAGSEGKANNRRVEFIKT